MSQSWRTEVDAADYFGNQKKKLEVADRRPVIRRPSDLVGPNIGSAATRITDFNDILATYNGFCSAAPGAVGAPNATDAFIGYVIMDDELGGEQVFRSLVDGVEYARTALRNPSDPTSITWSSWA